MISAEVYAGDSPGTLITALSEARRHNFLDQLNDTGSGAVEIHKQDSDLASFPYLLNYGNIIRILLDGTPVFAYVLESRDTPIAPPEEHSGEWYPLSGRGVLSLLENAVVYPDGGVGINKTVRQRTFDFSAIDYDDSAWISATAYETEGSPTLHSQVIGWPDGTAYWIWGEAPTGSPGASPAGTNYFRKSFTLGADATVAVFATGDNRLVKLYLDNEPILESTGANAYRHTFRADRDLTTGTHVIAAEVKNGTGGVAHPNPGGLLCVVYTLDEANDLDALVVHTDSTWLALDYPANVPGMSIGEIWRILVDEAQNRGGLPGITLGFTDTDDTNSNAWDDNPDIALDIGTNLLDVAQTFIEQFVDMDVTPTLELQIYNKGTYGTDLTGSVNLLVGEDFEDLQSRGLPHLTNSVLARDQNAVLMEVEDSPSLAARARKEKYIEFGLAPSEDRAVAMSDEVLAEFAGPSVELTGRVTADSGPYTTWRKGDLILMPDREGTPTDTQILSVAISLDEAGHPIFFVEASQDDAEVTS